MFMKNLRPAAANAQSSAQNPISAAITPEAPHIIVFGNEKGGSGKSTSAMHVAVGLLRMGYKVGTIDLDARQGTFSRYVRNRMKYAQTVKTAMPMPAHHAIDKSTAENETQKQAEEKKFLDAALNNLSRDCDFIVIDTPGTDSHLSRLAHSRADTLVTPMNDSFIDLDMLADVDPETHTVKSLSVYSKMVREQFAVKMEREGRAPRWIVMRNRLSHIDASNKRVIGEILKKISALQNFIIAPGFGERVIFRELFLKGITLLDINAESKEALTLSQVAARQEVRQLITVIGPEIFKTIPS
jgi:chromosome partitioning protein